MSCRHSVHLASSDWVTPCLTVVRVDNMHVIISVVTAGHPGHEIAARMGANNGRIFILGFGGVGIYWA